MRFLRTVVGVTGELLITTGVLLLLFLSWQLWWTDIEAKADQDRIVNQLEDSWQSDLDKANGSSGAADQVPEGDAFALLRIPRLGDDWIKPVVKGTTLETLNHGIGEYPNSAAPGAVGNFAIAGHRISWGRPFYDIETIKPGDWIVVETKSDYYVYSYVRHRIVMPTETSILAPVPDQPGKKPTEAWMTITACHPKFSAEQRYIGYAKLEKKIPRSQGLPDEYKKVK